MGCVLREKRGTKWEMVKGRNAWVTSKIVLYAPVFRWFLKAYKWEIQPAKGSKVSREGWKWFS